MKTEIFEIRSDEKKLELRVYEIKDGLSRILIDKNRWAGEVWGFDEEGKQHEGRLIDRDDNVVLLA